ncbi:hypothetical protein [Streptomyces sp. NBC_00343]|uniref:hypothetical protein n=1 Tax=Streptomyces sp. NBC_00343 TaxID=2975719 RepID=UPI002E2BB12C|nr:hypothetical protein [Streptomyces sp. NBC_00343]
MEPFDPQRAEPGRYPRLEAALATVNRDFAATLPDQPPLRLMVWEEQVYVAVSDGSWHHNGLQEPDDDAPDALALALDLVADAAQETVTERLWQAWPVCPFHKIGTHLRPEGTAVDWEGWNDGDSGRLVWWCRGGTAGGCHDLAPVGELGGALPGKERRASRRRERGGGRGRAGEM